MDGYEEWSESVEIEHSKKVSLTAVLQQLTGSLTIETEPANATITVDGNKTDNSPADVTDLKPGKHLVEVKMNGYKNWSKSIEIEHNKKISLTAKLQQLIGTLNINSEPTNATIIINGNEIGKSPADISDLKQGKHLVEIKMDGYEEWSESVEIEHNKKVSLTAVLQQLTGSLNIETDPANATIIIVGDERDNSPTDVIDL